MACPKCRSEVPAGVHHRCGTTEWDIEIEPLLRDVFAAVAMAAIISTSEKPIRPAAVAEHAYGYADAMLAARARGEGT